MTNPLKKALRGAATAGAELSMENYRANIQAKRDARLQQYQTSERVAGEAHDIKLQGMRDKNGGGAVQGDVQLMNYFQEKGIASSPEEAMNMVREMGTDPSKVIVDIAKSMHAADDSKPFSEYLKIAEGDVKSLRERLNPKRPEPAAPTKDNARPKGIINSGMVDQGGMIDQAIDQAAQSPAAPVASSSAGETVTIQTDDDYKKLASGTRYTAPDGKVRIKK